MKAERERLFSSLEGYFPAQNCGIKVDGGMVRADRHCIPGCVWHITHRCHKKKFLLRFAQDREHWLK
jgi:hypothetical protein